MGYNYPHFDSEFIQGLYNWQSLVGALIALAAAILGLWVSQRQSREQLKHAQELQRRRFRAARSTLALSLSALMDYVEQAARELESVHAAAEDFGHEVMALDFHAPRLPSEIVNAFERMVEAADTDELGDKVHAILSDLQTFQSRIGELGNLSPHRVGVQLEIEEYLIQAARIHRDVGELFRFARGEEDNDPAGTYMGTLRFAFDLDEIQFARVYARANNLDARQA